MPSFNGGSKTTAVSDRKQYSTFRIGERMYGIDVARVQEVVKPMPMTTVPLAPQFVGGLINLRGQVATAIGLRELFGLQNDVDTAPMNVVCPVGDMLVAFLVDEIGDVIEVDTQEFEETPATVPTSVRRFMDGVFKLSDTLLSIVNVDKVMNVVNDDETVN